jgi:hypothetical protein
MAGDWIKMRACLAYDPAVIGIAASLDITEFEVVGILHHLWSWADSQSRDGHAVGVTEKWINRFCQRDGFAAAMQKAGWLEITDAGVSFPNFERHNGETAKARGLAAIRKQKQRSNVTQEEGQMSRSERDESVTREEKRREESKAHVIASANDEQADEIKEPQAKADRIPYETIFETYSDTLPELPQPKIRDEARRRAIRSLWRSDQRFQSVDFWGRYYGAVRTSKFLMGMNGIGFDWLMKPANFKKVVEGNYQ